MTIFDASTLLGLMFGDERAAPAIGYLGDAAISSVNVAETIGKLAEAGMPSAMAIDLIHRLRLRTIAFGEDHAVVAGELRPGTSQAGLSLGDRACLATGLIDGDQVVTLDRAWSGLDLGVPVLVLE